MSRETNEGLPADLAASIARGLADSAAGRVHDAGDFTQYAEGGTGMSGTVTGLDLDRLEEPANLPREGALYEFDAIDFAGCVTGPWLGWWKASSVPGGGLWHGCFGDGMWSPQYVTAWRVVDVPTLLGIARAVQRVEALCAEAEGYTDGDGRPAPEGTLAVADLWAALGTTE